VSIAVDPAGKYVYAVNNQSNSISAYRIDGTTGALEPLAGSPYPTSGADPRSVTVDPSGMFAYVAIRDSNIVSAFAIDPASGGLSPLAAAATVRTRSAPQAVAIAKGAAPAALQARFVYVANSDPGDATVFDPVTAYSVDPGTGVLTPFDCVVPGADIACPAGESPQSAAVDPAGRFVYVANEESNSLSVALINSATGTWAFPSGSPIAAPAGTIGPVSVTADPSGRFVYASHLSGHISGYVIDQTSGRPTAMAGSPFDSGGTGSVTFSISAEPTGRFVYAVNRATVTWWLI
jgi:6-phosphogluconolactonase (cycloisomerase 2 family)